MGLFYISMSCLMHSRSSHFKLCEKFTYLGLYTGYLVLHVLGCSMEYGYPFFDDSVVIQDIYVRLFNLTLML